MPNRSALGLIETRGLVAAIEAADAAAKAAEVRITGVEIVVAALVTVKVEGQLGAVQASVAAGGAAAAKLGELVAAHVIPRPDDELDKILPAVTYINPARAEAPAPARAARLPVQIPSDEVLDGMAVVDLRRLARLQAGFPLAGREVSRANKQELIEGLRRWRDRSEPSGPDKGALPEERG
jgi:microcompartment protein CcmL/EutN